MKTLMLSMICLAAVSVQAMAQDDPSISGFQRGIICQAIDNDYPGKLRDSNGRPGWMNCREEASFSKISDYFGVMMKISDSEMLSCSARLSSGSGRNPVAKVKCKVVGRR